MTSKLERAKISHQKTSIRRAVKCPTCHWQFFSTKDEPQCWKCGMRFFQA